jgi:hypothetical protein
MSAVCATCGAVWAGATLGRLYHCDSATIAKIDQTKEQPYKVEKIAGKVLGRIVCECGQTAVRASSCDTGAKVCQRCYDCEKKNQRNFSKGSGSIGETYKVRMPRGKGEF